MGAWKHGQSPRSKTPETKEYRAWRNMLRRCYEAVNASYKYYGGRGITVYDQWRNDFIAFFAYVGPAPSRRHTIDREDWAGNYEPGNVRWALPSIQAKNRRANYGTEKRRDAVAAWRKAGPKALSKRVLCISDGQSFESIRAAADYYNVSKTTMKRIVKIEDVGTIRGKHFRCEP